MNKRLFIGVPVETNRHMKDVIKKIKITAQQKRMEVYWTPETNFHITLVFLGSTPEERISEIASILERITKEEAKIDTSLRGLGAFPDEHHARVLWIGVRKSRRLSALQERLASEMATLGFAQDDRGYTPHLTFGRLRKARTSVDLLSPFVRKDFADLEIYRVILYESVLHGAHPVYTPLKEFLLEGEEARDANE